MTDQELKEIRERCDKATEGPWELHDSCSWRRIGQPGHDGNIFSPFVNRYDGHPDLSGKEEDFDFTIRARTDIPKLLDEIERLKKQLNAIGISKTVGLGGNLIGCRTSLNCRDYCFTEAAL